MDRSFFHFITNHAFDRRTDRQTEFLSLDRICIAGSAVYNTRNSSADEIANVNFLYDDIVHVL